MSLNKISIHGERTFYIDRVDVVVQVQGAPVKASFKGVTEEGITCGRLIETDHPVLQKYIDDLSDDQYTDLDEAFYELFIESVGELDWSVGPSVNLGPSNSSITV